MPLTVVVTSGCPCGIGPEVSVGALHRVAPRHPGTRFVVTGDAGALGDAARSLGVSVTSLPNVVLSPTSSLVAEERVWGVPGASAGVAQLAAIEAAVAIVLAGRAHAMVTAPVSKHAITLGGTPFLGHTEHLAMRAGVARVVMLFAGPRLRVSLVSTHHAIAQVPACITRSAVRETIVHTAHAMRRWFGVAHPRLAVAGLNPHAGEGGLLGREELDVITPAICDARAVVSESEISGPVPAEAVFRHARDGRYDVVVAMYHDQATIASKLLDFGEAVNVTLGLPFVRTSVDHGTAYDIAGRGVADASGMVAALEMAISMASRTE